jgi:hypothetical protein
MKLPNSGGQAGAHFLSRADGAIVTGGTAQLVLPRSYARSFFYFQNTSSGVLNVEIGTGAATATITNGVLTSLTITNAGFGFTKPPIIRFLGGGLPVGDYSPVAVNQVGNTAYVGSGQPGAPSPNNVATAVLTISGGAISGYAITNPGSGYAVAPYCQIINSDLDPNGAALPSATVGFQLQAGGSINFNGTVCPQDPVAVWGATLGQTYAMRWMD